MNIFSDPSFVQISLVLLVLIGIAAYVRQFKAIAGLVFVYVVYIVVNGTFFTYDQPGGNQDYSEVSGIDNVSVHPENSKESSREPFIKVQREEQNQKMVEYPKESVSGKLSQKQVVPEKDSVSTLLQIQTMVTCSNVFVETRTPEEIGIVFPDSIGKVYCFTMVQNLGSIQSVTHEWSFEGNTISIIPMEIGRSHYWRSWSYQTIQSHKTGNWTVTFRDNLGDSLASVHFTIVKADSDI